MYHSLTNHRFETYNLLPHIHNYYRCWIFGVIMRLHIKTSQEHNYIFNFYHTFHHTVMSYEEFTYLITSLHAGQQYDLSCQTVLEWGSLCLLLEWPRNWGNDCFSLPCSNTFKLLTNLSQFPFMVQTFPMMIS